MSRKTIMLDVDPDLESLVRDYAAYLDEMKHLAASCPGGRVLDACEQAVVEKGREHQLRALQKAVQGRVDDAEKKGAR